MITDMTYDEISESFDPDEYLFNDGDRVKNGEGKEGQVLQYDGNGWYVVAWDDEYYPAMVEMTEIRHVQDSPNMDNKRED